MAADTRVTRFPRLSFIYAPYIPLIVSDSLIVDLSKFPHKCPRCKSAAYVGLIAVECSRKGCK